MKKFCTYLFIFVFAVTLPSTVFAAYSWTERQPAGAADKSWGEGDVSGSGSIMMVAVGDSPTSAGSEGRVYLSTNTGVSWAETQPAGNTNTSMKVRISTDGSLFMAGQDSSSSPGRLYVSTTTGSIWTEVRPAGNVNAPWRALATDSDGSVLIAGAYNSRIYISTTTSNTWSEVQPAGNFTAAWYSATTDSDGSVMLVGVNNGRLYLSTNTGSTWGEVQPAGNVTRQWFSLASDSDGSVLFAASGGIAGTRRLYLSKNTGSNWAEVQPAGGVSKNWASVDVSSDGSVLIATAIGGRVYFSNDTGDSWIETQPAGAVDKSWTIGAMSSNGAVFLAGAFFGRVYTGAVIDVTPPSVSSLSPIDGGVNVPTDSNFTITFNEDVATSTGNVVLYDAADDSVVETIDIAGAQVTAPSATSFVINPSVALLDNHAYYIKIDAGAIKDIATNPYAGISDTTTWNFSTPASPILTVTKVVTNDSGGSAVVGDFPLFVDGVSVTSGVATTTLVAGSYTISETGDAGYTAVITGDCAADGTITMVAGNTYTCTITNDDIAPTLTVTTTVTNDDRGNALISDFQLFLDGVLITSAIATTTPAGARALAFTLPDDEYNSTWGGDCAADGSITMALGETYTCTLDQNDANYTSMGGRPSSPRVTLPPSVTTTSLEQLQLQLIDLLKLLLAELMKSH